MELMKVVGQAAGLGGIALAMFLMMGKDVIRKNIFPTLTKEQSYSIINRLIFFTWSLALVGILGWIYLESFRGPSVQTGIHNEGTLTIEGDIEIRKDK